MAFPQGDSLRKIRVRTRNHLHKFHTSWPWLSMWTDNTAVVSSIHPCVTIKAPLVRKATGNHLIKSTSLEKLRVLSLISATLEIEYAMKLYETRKYYR